MTNLIFFDLVERPFACNTKFTSPWYPIYGVLSSAVGLVWLCGPFQLAPSHSYVVMFI